MIEIDLRQQAVLVDLVMVEQRAARRLADADALAAIDARFGAAAARLQVRIGQKSLEEFEARQDLDEPGIVKVKRRRCHASAAAGEIRASSASAQRHADPLADIEPGQRADAIDAVGIADRPIVRRLQIRILLDRLADVRLIVERVRIVDEDLAASHRRCGAGRRDVSQVPSGCTRPMNRLGKLPKVSTLLAMRVEKSLEEGQRRRRRRRTIREASRGSDRAARPSEARATPPGTLQAG